MESGNLVLHTREDFCGFFGDSMKQKVDTNVYLGYCLQLLDILGHALRKVFIFVYLHE